MPDLSPARNQCAFKEAQSKVYRKHLRPVMCQLSSARCGLCHWYGAYGGCHGNPSPLRPQLHFLLASASNASMVFMSYADDVAGHHFGQGLISIRTVYHLKQVTVTLKIRSVEDSKTSTNTLSKDIRLNNLGMIHVETSLTEGTGMEPKLTPINFSCFKKSKPNLLLY